MPSATPEHDYSHFRWTMPGGIPGGPSQPILFSIISIEMKLKEVLFYTTSLTNIININERNRDIMRQAVQNFLANPKHGPEQLHAIVFASAAISNPIFLQAGAQILFNLLEKRWPHKTISIFPLPWEIFQKIEAVATSVKGFTSGPPPSLN